MAEQSNSASAAIRLAATSTSSDGQLPLVETPSLSEDLLPVWYDEDGNNITLGLIDDLPVAYFNFRTGFGLSRLKYYADVIDQVDVALQEKGLDKYYVLVGNQRDYDFALWMGCEVAGLRVDKTRYELLERDLTL